MTLLLILLAVAAGLVASFGLGVLIGRGIRIADERRPR